jgi:hypothetical protein
MTFSVLREKAERHFVDAEQARQKSLGVTDRAEFHRQMQLHHSFMAEWHSANNRPNRAFLSSDRAAYHGTKVTAEDYDPSFDSDKWNHRLDLANQEKLKARNHPTGTPSYHEHMAAHHTHMANWHGAKARWHDMDDHTDKAETHQHSMVQSLKASLHSEDWTNLEKYKQLAGDAERNYDSKKLNKHLANYFHKRDKMRARELAQQSQNRGQQQEGVVAKNAQFGFLGTHAHDALIKATNFVKKVAAEVKGLEKMDDVMIGHFLDTKGGRHLAELMKAKKKPTEIEAGLKKTLGEFARTYNPMAFGPVAEAEDLHSYDAKRIVAHSQSAQTRFAADKKAREDYLASKEKKSAPDTHVAGFDPKVVKKTEPAHSTIGIHSTNPLIRDKAIGGLRIMMKEPIRAHEAAKKLSKFTDHVPLHKSIEPFSKSHPDSDVRPIVKTHMKRLGVRGF